MSTMLNKPFQTPYQSAPFQQINTSDFLPAIEEEIRKTREEIDRITDNTSPASFENTIEALEFAGQQLEQITSIFFNLNSAETNDEIQQLAQKISPLLTDFHNDIILNPQLFSRVAQVYNQKTTLALNQEQQMLLERKYKGFTRNGAQLPDDKKAELRKIDKELAALSLSFGEHTLAATNAYELHLTRQDDLKGLPETAIEAAAEEAKSRNKEGWVFTLHFPSYIPFMTYADNRELRKKLFQAYNSRAFKDTYNNTDIVLRIANLRHQRAKLLGYPSHAAFVLEERMAETPEKVEAFLEELLVKAKPAAEKEFADLSQFARATDGLEKLEKWDGAYYTEKLKQSRFSLDDEMLKPYFELNRVINGVFLISERLYGLKFEKASDIEVYHPEVEVYRVFNTQGSLVSLLYTDFHPRKGKRNGAWMTVYKPQFKKDGKDHRPHISIVCNFSKPTSNKPALLTFNEVTTLFHEFGHALHGMLAATTYPSLSGTQVYWDFVELPSQIYENWCYEKEALELFAQHYTSGETLPMELIERIKASSNFMEGLQTLRQLSFGMLDMHWHHKDTSAVTDVKAWEDQVFSQTDLYPKVASTCMSTSFSHIFQGGYSAGYYSYKWAEVLDADAFELFREKGIFNAEVAERFKNTVLSQGGTIPPMELYVEFRGQEPQPEALLKRAGLIS